MLILWGLFCRSLYTPLTPDIAHNFSGVVGTMQVSIKILGGFIFGFTAAGLT